jgi:SAM-dependent methyltransferase
MHERLLKILACPQCRVPLRLESAEARAENIHAGSLRCVQCGADYPIRGGIPRFVPGASYASTFSFEWKRWRRTQLDSDTRHTSQSTFVASTGRRPSELRGELVLDAGCGPGRYMDILARAGAEVVGIDLSLAVEVAQENLGRRPNCHFLQADLLSPPFLPETFDSIFSIGVLHHTPDPRRSFLGLVDFLKPGGDLAIWVYPRYRLAETFRYFPDRVNEVLAHDVNFQIPAARQRQVKRVAGLLDGIMETSSAFQRFFTTRLPPRWLYLLCHLAIPLYYVYRIPLFYPLRLLTKVAMDADPEWRVLDTFDWYSPQYQRKHTYSEVREWFARAGLAEITTLPRPVAVRGRKPAREASFL